MPTTYYGRKSGVALAIRNVNSGRPRYIGVIGLGTGTLAAYGRPGDRVRYYEINPLVIGSPGRSSLSERLPGASWTSRWETPGFRSNASRRRTSTCWRWMRSRAIRFPSIC